LKMTMSWSEFLAQRQPWNVQYLPCAGATRTVMVCSHIWWTEQIALAVLNGGCNVLLYPPLYTLYTDEASWADFDTLWEKVLTHIDSAKVDCMLGGNTSAMLVHPRSGEMIHEAARARGRSVTLINWWWDEVRTRPPLARSGTAGHDGMKPASFVKLLANEQTVNAIWDIDVKEELEAQLGLKNLVHVPLATLPEFWPQGYVPLERRPLAACFLGNCHAAAEWVETDADPLYGWARGIVAKKIVDPQIPMQRLIEEAGVVPEIPSLGLKGAKGDSAQARSEDSWEAFSRPMEVLNTAYMHYTRNRYVRAAEKHLHGKLALIGKGWDKLGLRANMEHAADKSGVIYGQSQVCLNMCGGCVHGGLPLRPYDIGASGGLIVTHDQRELPRHFEPGKECLVFRTESEMIELIDKVRAAPAEFNGVAQGGRRRVLAEHTWGHRVRELMKILEG
jgi:hypothetical protein